jgi:thiol-disulfide isomerase/thioredoxin
MKPVLKMLITACFVVVILTSVESQIIEFRKDAWEKVKADAKTHDKIIFVDAFTTWCGPCKWMDKNVFTDAEVADFYNANFINYKMDMEKGEGPSFGKTYEVNAYPTFLFIDGDGEIVHKKMGGMPPAAFIETGQAAMDPENNISALKKRYENGDRDPAFIQKYVVTMTNAYMDVSDIAEEYITSLSEDDLYTEETLKVLASGMDGSMDHPFFKILAERQSGFEKIGNPEMVRSVLSSNAKGALFSAIQRRDAAAFQKGMDQIQILDDSVQGEVESFAYMTKSKFEKDYDGYVKHTKKYAKKYLSDDWSGLNSLAWEIYEDEQYAGKKYLKLGAKLAQKSVKLQSASFNNDTYAALLFKLGKYAKAKGYAETAIRLAKKEGEDPSMTEELLSKIKSKM